MTIHSRILAWRIPWTEEPGRLQSMGSHRIGYDGATTHPHKDNYRKERDWLEGNEKKAKSGNNAAGEPGVTVE